jgi:hypothetical protein
MIGSIQYGLECLDTICFDIPVPVAPDYRKWPLIPPLSVGDLPHSETFFFSMDQIILVFPQDHPLLPNLRNELLLPLLFVLARLRVIPSVGCILPC